LNQSREQLLDAVKKAVAMYGISGMTTRKLAEAAGINDGLIYLYFDDKESIFKEAYERESNAIFLPMLGYIRELRDVSIPFPDKARLYFHRTWRELLSDPDRMLFVDRYYHSAKFSQSREHHEKQVALLLEELEEHFESREVCIQMMYALMTQLYDSAVRVVEGQMDDTPETEELSFSIFWGLLSSQIKNTDE
jgi:AcrR family transcriptional regulator